MSDLVVTASGVVPANVNTPILRGTVFPGETIAQGQAVYPDPNNAGQIRKAQSNNSTASANFGGITLNGASGGQPIAYTGPGDVTLPTTGTGTTLVVGQVYVVSAANAGGIAPLSDLASGNYVSVVGVATSTNNLRQSPIPTSTQKP